MKDSPAREEPPPTARASFSEAERLAALESYSILDTPRERDFDDIVQLAAEICDAPIAIVNLVAADRQWFKAEQGLGVCETPLDVSICAQAILQPGLFVVPDLAADARFAGNPLVSGEPRLRFYAGALLQTPDGLPLGTLCVLDNEPRPDGLDGSQAFALAALARQVMGQFELRRQAAGLARSEERFRKLSQASDEGICLHDGRVLLDCNVTFATMFGYGASEEVVGIKTTDLVALDALSMVREVNRAGGEEPYEVVARRKDGSTFPARFTGKEIEFQGRPVRVKVVRDLTDRHQAQAALEASEEQLRLLADALPVMVSYVDADRRYRFVNAAYERWFERPRETIIGQSIAEVLGEDAHAARGRQLGGVLRGEPQHFEALVSRPDGSRRDTETEYLPRRNAAGEVIGFYVLVADITERKQSEMARAGQARTLETLNRTGAIIASELDLERVVQMVTDAGVELTGAQLGAFFYNVKNETGESYMLYTLSGVGRAAFEGFPMPRNTAIFAPTFNGEGVVRSDDILADRRYGKSSPHFGMPKGHLPVRSFLAVPVISRSGEVIGGLFFGHERPGIFTDTHEQLMTGIAGQAAVAIDNARLFQSATTEVEARRTVEAALAESESKFRAIVDCVDQMIWSTRPDGHHDYYNQRWYDYTGVAEGSTHGEAWNGMFHPEDQERAWARWRHALATGEPYHIEYRLRHRSGQYRWVLGRAQPVRDDGGHVVRWYGTCTDIQEIVEAREVLALSREELEREVEKRTAERDRVWKLIPDLLMMGSLDGSLLSINPAWTEVLGYDEATLLKRPFREIIDPDYAFASDEAVRQMREGRAARHRNRVRTASGDYRWFDWVSTPVGDLFYAVARDITEEKEREVELGLAQEALRQAQKMEAVGQLTGGIAHDFNNMLAVVIGSLDLLGRRIGTADPRARRYVDAATDGARRAALLTQRLLAFSRQQPLRPESIDANKLVAGMSDLLRHSLGSAIRLETVLAGGLWRTHADPNQLENALLNLAVNARDAMPEGGRLTIEMQNAHLDGRYSAAHLGVQAGQYVMIAVTDTGAGMRPEVMAKAFDPFFTTKDVGKGTGLGLSQVYGFMKQSGGHVKIYSEPGQGTTIKLYLPRYIGARDVRPEDDAMPEMPFGERQEVLLVVEDEAAVRQFSVDALRELGYRALEADGAAAALRLLDAHPEIALLFTDIVMPDVNGRKLADEARRRRPALKVLFTTGYTRNAVVHNGVLDSGVELISKPFTIEELAVKVREVLDTSVAGMRG